MQACISQGVSIQHEHVGRPKNVKQIIYNERIHGIQSKHPVSGWRLTVYILSRSSTEQSTFSCKHTMLCCVSGKLFSWVHWNETKMCGCGGPTFLLQPSSTTGVVCMTNAALFLIKAHLLRTYLLYILHATPKLCHRLILHEERI